MKKNLHFVLALTLGLATTVSAQDWSVDSRTRVNSAEEEMSTDQRVRAAVEFGGEAVSFYAEVNSSVQLGEYAGQHFETSVRQAYATTNLMDFASLTAGRMALTFGSGRIVGDNDWTNGNGNTVDGLLFSINNDFADVHVGYSAAQGDSNEFVAIDHDGSKMYANIAKDMGNMGFNLFYMTKESEDMLMFDETSMGLDANYSMDNGATLTLGYYTHDNGTSEMDLTTLGVSYGVNDDLTVHAGYDMYGENGFYMKTGSFGNRLGSGMNYASFDGFEGTDMSFGGSYTMGDFSIGATMHTVESEDELTEYSVTDLSLGYTLSENSTLKVNYATSDQDGEDYTQTWISLHVGF